MQSLPLKTLLYSWNTNTKTYADNESCPLCDNAYDTLQHLPQCSPIDVQKIWNETLTNSGRNPADLNIHVVFDEQIPIKINDEVNVYIGYYGAINTELGRTPGLEKKQKKRLLRDFYIKYVKQLHSNYIQRFVKSPM